MVEYLGLTHTIVEMMARTKIKAVPRNTKTKRIDLRNVGRPDDDRKGDVPTRQGEIIRKVLDEDDLGPITPKEMKKPRKLEIQDVGKQPPSKVEINPELDNTPNLFASMYPKGSVLAETGNDPFITDAGKERDVTDTKTGKVTMKLGRYGVWKHDGRKHQVVEVGNDLEGLKKKHGVSHDRVAKMKEETISEDDKPDAKSKKEAEDIANFTKQFQGKSFGGFKITGKLTADDIEAGARIRARLNKLKEGAQLTPKQYASQTEYERKSARARAGGELEKYKGRMAADRASRSRWRQERQKKIIDEGRIKTNDDDFWKTVKKEREEKEKAKWAKKWAKTDAKIMKAHETRLKKNLKEDKYNNTSIQYQNRNGLWITARKTTEQPNDIMMAMQTVQKAYSSNRVRAIGSRGTVLDMWPINPSSLQQENYVRAKYGRGTFKGSRPSTKRSRESKDRIIKALSPIMKPLEKFADKTVGKFATKADLWLKKKGVYEGKEENEAREKARRDKNVKKWKQNTDRWDKWKKEQKEKKLDETSLEKMSKYTTKVEKQAKAFGIALDEYPRGKRQEAYLKTLKKISDHKKNINETSRKKMAEYIPAAANDQAAKMGEMKIKRHDSPSFKKLVNAYVNRKRGIRRAAKKLSEEQVNELAASTYGSYINKASEDRETSRSWKAKKMYTKTVGKKKWNEAVPTIKRRLKNRKKGIARAVRSLTKDK